MNCGCRNAEEDECPCMDFEVFLLELKAMFEATVGPRTIC